MHDWALLDGQLVPAARARVSAFDRTLLYGLGAFETLRLFGGRPFLLAEHLARMHDSLASVGLAAPSSLALLEDALPRLAERAQAPECLARVTVTAGTGVPGASDEDGMHVVVGLRAAPASRAGREMIVGTVDFAHDTRSPLAGVKSTSYLVHYMLRERAEAEGRLDDLMLTSDGRITEATVANVFLVREGRLATPALSGEILPGVTREQVMQLASEARLEVEQRPIRREELARFDEAFLTGSGKGLIDIDVLDGHRLPAERPVSAQLARALAARIERHCGLPEGSVRF